MLNVSLFSPEALPFPPDAIARLEKKRADRKAIAALTRQKNKELDALMKALQGPMFFLAESMDLPIEVREDIDLDEEEEDPAKPKPKEITVTADGPAVEEPPIIWTPDDLVSMHSCMLEENFKILAARGNPKEKLDVLKWIFESEWVAEVANRKTMVLNGETVSFDQRRVIYNRDCGFTFSMCCRLEGFDPDVFRTWLKRNFAEATGIFLFSSKQLASDHAVTTRDDLYQTCF